MDNNDKVFADGLIVKRHENAPDSVICKLSIKRAEFEKFMAENSNDGWINLDVKRSRKGKLYAELDQWKPDDRQSSGGDRGEDESYPPF